MLLVTAIITIFQVITIAKEAAATKV